jgi:hypothetical protein
VHTMVGHWHIICIQMVTQVVLLELTGDVLGVFDETLRSRSLGLHESVLIQPP